VNYQQTLDYLFAQLPMFHRVGPAAYKPGLDNTIQLLNALDNPHKDLKCIHIAGTNGKGSTSHLLASILQQAGYKTGLYTSPHLKDFRERIRINGEMIPEDVVIDFVNRNQEQWAILKPSFFEITVAMCFTHFHQQKVDVAVIETGLGGRLDSTNVIQPVLSVITNVSFDHMNLLGNTIEAIAAEKAGIIKPKIPVVIGPMKETAKPVMMAAAEKLEAPLTVANKDLLPLFANCPLQGIYQQENFQTVGTAVAQLRQMGYDVSNDHVKSGAENVLSNTGLAGRWQILNQNPLTIADVAHNEDGLRAVVHQLDSLNKRKLHFVLGMVADKDIAHVLPLLPKTAEYYFCKADIPRGMAAEELASKAKDYGLLGQCFDSVKAAYERACAQAESNDVVFVGGSIFTVAEVL
jgi:dihydrofolate synthase / folylpolyglutamate synthase